MSRARLAVAVAALGALAAGPADAASIRVPQDQPTIAAALAVAQPLDSVVVAPGVYAENLVLPGDVTLRGAGAASSVVLDGGGAGAVVVCQGTGPSTRLESVTLRGGAGLADGAVRVGGSLVVRQGSLRLAQVSIENGEADLGGGIFLEDASLRWTGGSLTGNRADWGGGLFARRGDLELFQVVVAGNTAERGGGVGFSGVTLAQLIDCEFVDNEAAFEGGAVHLVAGAAVASNSRFRNNRAGLTGGAWHVDQGGVASASFCVFFDNQATAAGGAVYAACEGVGGAACAQLRLFHADVVANRAADAGAGAAAGAALLRYEASVVVANQGGPSCLDPRATLEIACTDLAANGSDAPPACAISNTDNLSVDPYLCDLAGGNLMRCNNSPLLAPPPCGGAFLGALGEGCATCGPTPADSPSTWGRIKATYR